MKQKLIVALFSVCLILAFSACTTQTSQSEVLTVFEQFENSLDDSNVIYEKVTMAAELVGALQGIKYETDKGIAEIYIFDMSSDSYKNAVENQALELDGFGPFEAVVKNGMALLLSDDADNDFFEVLFDKLK